MFYKKKKEKKKTTDKTTTTTDAFCALLYTMRGEQCVRAFPFSNKFKFGERIIEQTEEPVTTTKHSNLRDIYTVIPRENFENTFDFV